MVGGILEEKQPPAAAGLKLLEEDGRRRNVVGVGEKKPQQGTAYVEGEGAINSPLAKQWADE